MKECISKIDFMFEVFFFNKLCESKNIFILRGQKYFVAVAENVILLNLSMFLLNLTVSTPIVVA